MNYIDFRKLWKLYAGETALLAGQKAIRYHDLHLQVKGKINDLQQAGISAGDRVALFGKTDVSFILNFLALLHMGVISVPLSTRFSGSQLNDRLRQISCAKIIAPKSAGGLDISADITFIDIEDSNRGGQSLQLPHLPLTQPATIMFTSGSSASPKAVLHTVGNHYFSALGAAENMPLKPGDRWLVTLPLYHVGGLAILIRSFLAGATAVIPQENQSLSDNIRLSEISHVSLVPTQLLQLLDGHTDFQKLRAVLVGGAALPHNIISRALQAGLPLYLSYGSTEMASQITTTTADDPSRLDGKCGPVLAYRALKIAEDDEILVRGSTLSPGYVEGTQLYPLMDADGWYHTSDLGAIDAQGRLKIVGRKDNMFISGGENIYPEEIESILCTYEGIVDALVVEIPDEKFGFRPVAFVKLIGDKEIDENDLRGFMASKIERFKIPVHFFPWPDREIGLKISRKQFRKIAGEWIHSENQRMR